MDLHSHLHPSDVPSTHQLQLLEVSYLRLSQTIQVGDVKDSAHGSGVDSTRPPLLQTQVAEDQAESRVLSLEKIQSQQLQLVVVVVVRYLAEQGQLDVDPRPQTSAQVGGTREDIAEPLVPHELPALLLDQTLHLRQSIGVDVGWVEALVPTPAQIAQPHLLQASAEPLKDPLHVPTPLHGDDPGVVLLVDPNQEVLLVVVPVQKFR